MQDTTPIYVRVVVHKTCSQCVDEMFVSHFVVLVRVALVAQAFVQPCGRPQHFLISPLVVMQCFHRYGICLCISAGLGFALAIDVS